MTPSLAEAACAVLAAAEPADKMRLTLEFGEAWRGGGITAVGARPPPARPARPLRPDVLPPNRMPKRGYGGPAGKAALYHALAHIELNAIDLAWDIVARFTAWDWPTAFYDDWVQVAVDEVHHFAALEGLLAPLGVAYGDLAAHDGLWQAAEKTMEDPLDRLALVPMTLEVRGCDTTPTTIARLARSGETAALPALEVILADEIRHVAAGVRWFEHLCARQSLDPVAEYHARIRRHFPTGLKEPFNDAARAQAGMAPAYYRPLAAVKVAPTDHH